MTKKMQKFVSAFIVASFFFTTALGSGYSKVNAFDGQPRKPTIKVTEEQLKEAKSKIKQKKFSHENSVKKFNEKYKTDFSIEESKENKQIKNPDEIVRVVVQLKDKPLSEKSGFFTKKKLQLSQNNAKIKAQKLEGAKIRHTYTYLVNGFSMDVKRSEIANLEKLPGVKNVKESNVYYPDMNYAKEFTQAFSTWEDFGYKGEGMVVSIIDSGIDPSHKDMRIEDTSKIKLTDRTPEGPGKYYTVKVPYGYNYADGNFDIVDKNPIVGMHGMHVAGIVGANGKDEEVAENKAVKGVAPECQLLAMKVFSNDPNGSGAYTDDVVAAIEDSVKLGADVINMSLGSVAGFQGDDVEQTAIKNAVNKGVVVVVSAGNSAYSTSPYKIPWLPDTGLVGAPGLCNDSIQVASYENNKSTLPAFNYVAGEESGTIGFTFSEKVPSDVLIDKDGYEIVDCGLGKPEEFVGKDLTGKIALIQRGELAFVDKKLNAQAAGALGAIVYNSETGGDSYISMATDPAIKIPGMFITNTDGKYLSNLLENGVRIAFKGEVKICSNANEAKMSDFTSWGPAPNLDFKPEITGPGGQIYSTVNNNKYETMNGTSMSAPHVSGAEALIVQAKKANNPNLKGRELVEFVKRSTINTAKIIEDKDNGNVPYSPRRQGAGMIQIKDAIKNNVTVTYNGNAAAALKEIGKSKTFSLDITNYGDSSVTYTLENGGILTEAQQFLQTMTYDVPIEGATMTFDKKTITVASNETSKVDVTINLPDDFHEDQFVEGFVKFTTMSEEDYPSLICPYIAFYGDWSRPDVVDYPMWDQDNTTFEETTLITEGNDGNYNYLGSVGEAIVPEIIAISPNGDAFNDNVVANLTFLRNAKSMKMDIVDNEGKYVTTAAVDNNIRKIVLDESDFWSEFNPNWSWDGTVFNEKTGEFDVVPDGQYYVNIVTKADMDDAMEQTKTMPVKVDTVAPVVDITSGQTFNEDGFIYAYDETLTSEYTLKWKAEDGLSGLLYDNNEQANGWPSIIINGNLIEPEVLNYDEESKEYSCTLNLNEGFNEIIILAFDNAGNAGEAYFIANYVDKTTEAPAFTFDNLWDGLQVNGDEITEGKYIVTGSSAGNVSSFTIGNKNVVLNDDGTFEVELELLEGSNVVNLNATDDNGHQVLHEQYEVFVDTMKPEIKLTTPEIIDNKISVTEPLVLFLGHIEDTNPVELYINENKGKLDSENKFGFMLQVPAGASLLDVTAIDSFGNITNYEYKILAEISDEALSINLTDATDSENIKDFVSGTMLNYDEVKLVGTINQKVDFFQINDETVEITDYEFSKTIKLNQGLNKVKIYAEDDNKVVANYAYNIYCDTIEPKIEFLNSEIKDGKLIVDKLINNSFELKGKVSDNAFGYRFFINGKAIHNVNLDSFDEKATVRAFNYFVNSENSKDKLNVTAIDQFANETNYVLEIDLIAPEITVDGVEEGKTYEEVTPIITTNKSDAIITAKLNGENFESGSTIKENGHYELEVIASLGDTQSTYKVTFDVHNNYPKINVNNEEPTNKDVMVTLNLEGKGSLEYKINDGEWNVYTKPFAISENCTIYYRSKDLEGNVIKEESLVISNIDKTAPKTPVIQNSITSITNKDVEITITAEEGAKIEYKINDGEWTEYAEKLVVKENCTVYAKAADSVGNVSTVANFKIENIDKLAPAVPQISVNVKDATNKDVEITITAEEGAKIEYKINDGEWIEYAGKLVVKENCTVYAKATDSAGNVGAVGNLKIENIDKVSPSIIITDVEEGKVYNDSVTPKISVEENVKTVVLLDGKNYNGKEITKAGKHVLKVLATDVAGNTSEKVINFTIKDTIVQTGSAVDTRVLVVIGVILLGFGAAFIALSKKRRYLK